VHDAQTVLESVLNTDDEALVLLLVWWYEKMQREIQNE
jgi:hypothetical protein